MSVVWTCTCKSCLEHLSAHEIPVPTVMTARAFILASPVLLMLASGLTPARQRLRAAFRRLSRVSVVDYLVVTPDKRLRRETL